MQSLLVYIVIGVAVIYCIVAIIRGAKRMNRKCTSEDCDSCSCKNHDKDGGCSGC